MDAIPEITFIQRKPEQKVLKTIRAERITIGKRPDCDIQLPHHRVSPRHAILTWERGTLWVADQMTVGGTIVDGRPVQDIPVELRDGGELAIGEFVIAVQFGGGSVRHPSPLSQ